MMNILDAIVIGIVAFNFLIGFSRGLLRKALGIGVLLVSVAIAYLYQLSNEGVFNVAIVFVAAEIVLSALVWLIMKIFFKSQTKPTLNSRIWGGIIGGLQGGAYILVVLLTLHFSQNVLGAVNPAVARHVDQSFIYSSFNKLYPAANVAKAKEPALDEETVSKLRENPSMKAILEDKELVQSIADKDYAKILSSPKFFSLLNDKELLAQLMQIGATGNEPTSTAVPDSENNALKVPNAENRLTGIAYSQGAAAVIIDNELYRMGDEVNGGKIVEIKDKTITIEFPSGRKQFAVGERIQ